MTAAAVWDHGVTDDDGNLLLGQRADGSPIWNDAEDPRPLRHVAHFTEEEARRKAWELASAGFGPTGISKLHHSNMPHGVALPAPAEPERTALARQRRLVATLPKTREDAEALLAGHRDLWRVDLPDGAYTQLPGDPPGPAALRRVQNGIVYDVQPLSGRLIPASKPRMLPGCVTAAVGVEGAQPAQRGIHVECRECQNCGHAGINDTDGAQAACNSCEWQGPAPKEDQCPGCGRKGTMIDACPECGSGRYTTVAERTLGVSASDGQTKPPAHPIPLPP